MVCIFNVGSGDPEEMLRHGVYRISEIIESSLRVLVCHQSNEHTVKFTPFDQPVYFTSKKLCNSHRTGTISKRLWSFLPSDNRL